MSIEAYVKLLSGALALMMVTSRSSADMVSIGPFAGQFTETWEEFPTTFDGDEQHNLPSPASIFGGMATIANPKMDVYQRTGTPYYPTLGTSGPAQTSDGIKGMIAIGFAQPVTIEMTTPVLALGAYWGAWTHTVFGTDPAVVSLSFYDDSNQLIGSDSFLYSRSQQQDGMLEWHGWASTVSIKTIVYTSDYPTIDGLQATTVPEPATISSLALAILSFARYRRRRDAA